MTHNKTTFYILLLSSIPYLLYSQQLGVVRFENINSNSIISTSNSRAITEDDKGFLWVATSNGLCRYDPNGKVTTILKDDSNTLKSNSIRSLLSDRSGNLWIGTFSGGLTRFNPKENTWKTFFPDTNDPQSICDEDILSLLEDRQGRIWIGTENGLSILNPKTETFTNFYPNRNDNRALQVKAVVSILEDHAGRIWLGTWSGGLYLALPHESQEISKTTFRRFDPNTKKRSHNVWKIYQDRQNRYWVGTYGEGLFLMQLPVDVTNDPGYQTWQPKFYQYSKDDDTSFGLASNNLFEINQDQQNRLWITSNHGISHVEAADLPGPLNYNSTSTERPPLKFITHLNHIEKSHTIRNNCVNTAYIDKNNIIWFGTLEGLSKFNPNPIMFEYINLSEEMTKSDNCQNIFIDQDKRAWITNNEKGLLVYDTEQKKHISLPSELRNKITTINGLSAKNEYLYLGTQNGFQKLNRKNWQLKNFILPDSLIQKTSGFRIKSIFVDEEEQVWIGTDNGLIRYNSIKEKFYTYTSDINDTTSISDNSISYIFQDSRKNIWISTYNGLNKIQNTHQDKVIFQRYKRDSKQKSGSIISNQIISIEEANGDLYLSTTVGICKYDYSTDTFSHVFTQGEQFYISSLKQLEKNFLWGSSTQGIVRFNLSDQSSTLYGRLHGIWDFNFNSSSAYRTVDNYLYFGSKDGLTRFHPKDIKTNTTPPEVFITEVKLSNDYQDTTINTLSLESLFIPKNYRNISVTFTSSNFDRSAQNQFVFRLKGFEKTWHTPQNSNTVHYTNLNNGDYTFQVKGANCDGIWNENSTDLPITIEAKFYETKSFYLFVLLAIAGIIYIGFKIYIRTLTYRNQQMEILVNQRTKELASKNKEIESLLTKVKTHNEVLEATVNQRTKKLIEANEELSRSNQDLEQFAYIASHDLQEPLRTVGSFVNLLGRKYANALDDNAKQYIDFAVDGVTRMSKLITSTLLYSKVGKKELKFGSANIANTIELKLRDLQTKITENKVEIETDLNDLPPVICEKNQIGMVFYNLINNGIKFNKAAYPKITIKYHPDHSSDFWTFSVTDNGIGIEPEYHNKIFEIFRRLHTKTEYDGSGIGLALCKKIIFRHKGSIWVDSTHGQGSTFYFTIAKHLGEQEQKSETSINQETNKMAVGL